MWKLQFFFLHFFLLSFSGTGLIPKIWPSRRTCSRSARTRSRCTMSKSPPVPPAGRKPRPQLKHPRRLPPRRRRPGPRVFPQQVFSWGWGCGCCSEGSFVARLRSWRAGWGRLLCPVGDGEGRTLLRGESTTPAKAAMFGGDWECGGGLVWECGASKHPAPIPLQEGDWCGV